MARILALLTLLAASLTAAPELKIYFIDVEGGKSVLFVSPSGQSMLFDVGWPATNNRTASTEHIVEAVRAAGLKKIDLLIISHFDLDHLGDVPALAAKIPIGRILDHGDYQISNPQAQQRFAPYAALREKLGHTVLKVGDKVPLFGVDIQVLSSAGQLITKPLPGAGKPNPLCDTYKQQDVLATDVEDNQSVGLLITFGKFRMLDLADLEAHHSHDLVCPANLVGTVDVYNVNVHGQFKGIAPEMVGALHALAIIQANGARKGADAKTWPVLQAAPRPKDIWQLHYSLNAGEGANPSDDFIANLEPEDGFKWLQLSASKSGKFTVTNTRNNFSKQYK